MKCLDSAPHPPCHTWMLWLPRACPVLYRGVSQLAILGLDRKVKTWLRNVIVHMVLQYQS